MVSKKQTIYMLTIVLWSINSKNMLPDPLSTAPRPRMLIRPVSAFSQSCLLSSRSEKSIIKTLQSQQKQFMAEKQRREERNEGILRSLDRIDYQASSLAAKTERLRTLKVRACYMKN